MQSSSILEALFKYSNERNLRLHMPGHLGGRGMPAVFGQIAALDVSEVPGIDDLHRSGASIKAALERLARTYGAKESFLLVNGATSGLHALLLSLPGPNATVLIPRNAHRSLWGGLVLSGAFPVYIPCSYDHKSGIAVALEAKDVKEKLIAYQDARAVFVTSPTYYGTTSKIDEICKETKKHQVMLIVDEAHGGHFAFHPDYPCPALKQGADAVVNGLHKTLPVLNQGGCIHIGREFAYREQLALSWSLLTTTSPSFPLLASIDEARLFMENRGYELLEAARQRSILYRKKINELKSLQVYDGLLNRSVGVDDQDPLKLTIQITGSGISGYELAAILRNKYHIQVELQEPRIVLAMMSIFHTDGEWEILYEALRDIDNKYLSPGHEFKEVPIPPIPAVVLSPRQSFYSPKRVVKIQDCEGKVAGEMIAPYPPGIPCLLPGEVISAESLEYLWYIKQSKLTIHGAHDPELNHITILG